MQIFLSAHDKKGKPIIDLKADELSVTADGSPVKLDDFRFVNGDQKTPELVTFVFDRSVLEENRDRGKKSSKILSAREAASKILEMLPERGFELSVFNVDSRLHLVQDFTADRYVLGKAIDTATEKPTSGQSGKASATEKQLITMALSGKDSNGKRVTPRERHLAQSLYAALKNSGRIAQDRHIAPSFSGLMALVESQQNLPGRKTLVYLSWIDQARIKDKERQALEAIIGSANQAGVSIDVIDCSALGQHGSKIKTLNNITQGAVVQMNTMRTPGGSVTIAPDQSTLEVYEDAPVDADLKHLAEATGGSYFNGDSQRKVFEQLVGDMATYYEASFVPKSKEYDGKFHPIEVKPLRKGLKIRTQTGYLALPPSAEDGSTPQPFELPLLKLLKQSPLPSEVPFRAAILDLG
ncbi:MAG: VWA domain-containing protein, partial [Acidobacteriota bacterium]|nr:VWA domain-containing protein [Acidobacteriota bacterium]